MSFVARELARIQSALGNPEDPKYPALWAAQQALSWALEPTAFASPYVALTGNQEGAEGCWAGIRPPPS